MARDMSLLLQGLGAYVPEPGLREDQYVPIPWLKNPNEEPGIMNPGHRRERRIQVAGGGLPDWSGAYGAAPVRGMEGGTPYSGTMEKALINFEQQKLLIKALKELRGK